MTTVALADVAEIIMGQAPPGDSYNTEGEGLPLIAGAGDFKAGRLAPARFTTRATKRSQPGDIVLSIRASIGDAVWSDGEYCLGRGVAALRARSEFVDRSYLWHWLANSSDALRSKGRGATFLQVNRTDIGEMPLPLPQLVEQRRIAAILDQADAIRSKRRQVLTHLDSFPQSLYRSVFGDPLAKRWPMRRVEEVAANERYAIVDGPFGSSLKPGDYRTSGVPVIRIKNIRRSGDLDLTDLLFIDESKYHELQRSALSPNDVLVTRVGTLGNSCVFPKDVGPALLSTTGVCKITTDHDVILPQVLRAAISMPSFQAQIRRSASTSVQAYFNLTALKSWKIAVPPMDMQRRFVELTEAVSLRKNQICQILEADDELFSSLQSRAFRGEL